MIEVVCFKFHFGILKLVTTNDGLPSKCMKQHEEENEKLLTPISTICIMIGYIV